MSTPTEQISKLLRGLYCAFLVAPVVAFPQEESDEVLELSPFVVDATEDVGYRATNSISGTRLNTALEDTSMAIQVFTQERIADMEANDIEDLFNYAAGVKKADNVSTSLTSDYNIRGFTSGQLLLDGLRTTSSFQTTGTVERVEVVKGPLSVLYGQMNPGGIVNMIMKRPAYEKTGSLQIVGGGPDSYYRGMLDTAGPLNEQKTLAYRLVLSHQHEEFNIDFFERSFTTLSPSIEYRPNDNVTLTFSYTYLDVDGTPGEQVYNTNFTEADQNHPRILEWKRIYGIEGDLPASGGFIRVPDTFIVNGEEVEAERGGRPISFYRKDFGPSISGYADSYNYRDIRRYDAEAVLKFNDSITYRFHGRLRNEDNALDRLVGGEGFVQSQRPGLFAIFDGDTLETFTMRNELLAKFELGESGRADVIFGHEYQDGEQESIQFRSINPLVVPTTMPTPANPHFEPSELQYPNFDSALIGDTWNFRSGNASESETNAYYAIGQVSLLENRLNVFGGVRIDDQDVENRDMDAPGVFSPIEIGGAEGNSYQAGVNYELRPGFSPFLNYTTSFQPNGVDQDGDILDPQTGEGIDLGVKLGLWNNRLSGTISYFDLTREDIPRNVTIDTVDGVFLGSTTVLSGEESSEGIDWELNYAISDRWQVVFTGSYMDTAIVSDDEAPENELVPSTNDSAEWMLSAFTRYRFSEGPLQGLSIGGGINYVDETLIDTRADRVGRQTDDVTMLDLFAKYETIIFDRDVIIQFNVDNVTDTIKLERDRRFTQSRRFKLGFTLPL